jgi:hypothetical protein
MPNNEMKLQVQNSGLYLSAPLSDNSSGTHATQETDPTSDNSTWEMVDAPNNPGWFLLQVKSSGLYLNIANSGMINGDPATLENLPSPVTDNFLWQKIPVSGSTLWCMFKVKHSGQFLNIEGLDIVPGINACQGEWNSTPNFYWLEQPKEQWKKKITINLQIDCPDLISQLPNGGVVPNPIANADLVFSDDNRGQRKNGSNNQIDFESFINPGNTVVWKASTKSGNNSQYTVSIDSIQYDMGSGSGNIFDGAILTGNNGSVTADVIWRAMPPANDGDNETYTVNFIVTPKNGTPISYSVDPKLRIDPGTAGAR